MNEADGPDPSVPAAAEGLDVAALFDRAERLVLGGERRYTRAEVCAQSGVSPEGARRLWKALGFAAVADDDVVFTDSDVTALRRVKRLVDDGLADDEMRNAITRMLGQMFSRLASWQGQLLIEMITSSSALRASEDAIVEMVGQLLPELEQIQSYVWRRQLVAYFSRIASNASAEVAVPVDAPVVVGFADMSGFTTLTRHASEAELRELLEAFESAATDVVGSHRGRVVKTIGDEVLFLADSAPEGAQIALELLDAAGADDRLPPLRVGLAAGPVVSRLGDVYGSTVNVASRLTTLSRPGWILVDRVMAEALRSDERFTLKARRPESVRGFHHLRQWRLRRAGEDRRGRSGDVRRGKVSTFVERAVGQR